MQRFITLLIAVCVLSSCTRAKFDTNRDAAYVADIKKLTVLEYNIPVGPRIENFNRDFSKLLSDCKIASTIAVNPSAEQKPVKADATLAITLTSLMSHHGSLDRMDYELTLLDSNHKKVWKSLVYHEMNSTIGILMGKSETLVLAQSIIKQMQDDQILTTCPPMQE